MLSSRIHSARFALMLLMIVAASNLVQVLTADDKKVQVTNDKKVAADNWVKALPKLWKRCRQRTSGILGMERREQEGSVLAATISTAGTGNQSWPGRSNRSRRRIS